MTNFVGLIALTGSLAFGLESVPTPKNPRVDLYQKISSETGFSLSDAASALLDDDRSKQDSLRLLSRKIGTARIEKTFEDEISRKHDFCVSRKIEATCKLETDALKTERDEFLKLAKSVAANPDKKDAKSLSFAASLYLFEIREKVLWPAIAEFDKQCPESKSNQPNCRDSAIGIGHLEEIGRDLSIVSSLRANGEKPETEFTDGLKRRVAIYAKK